MKNKKKLLVIILAFSCVWMLSACRDQAGTTEPVQTRVLVKTMVLGNERDPTKRVYPGRVVANKKVDLAFQVPGQLNQLPVSEGKKVKKEALLAELDPRDYQSQLDSAKATYVKSQQDYERAKILVKNGTIPESVFDEKLAKRDIANSEQKQAQKALDDTQLRAPFSGVIANVYVENFENVHAKELILSLQDVSHIDIEVNIPEQDIIQLKPEPDQSVHGKIVEGWVNFNGIPNKKFNVFVKEYSTEADPIAQTYKITLTMPTPDDVNVLPGMNANLHLNLPIPDAQKNQGFLVPTSAVLTDHHGKHYVWIVDSEKMQVKKQTINITQLNPNHVNIKGNIKQGDIIVVAGVNKLKDDQVVKILKTEELF